MNLKSTSRFLTDGFLYILVFPLIIRRTRGEGNRAFDIEELLIDYYLPELKDQYYSPAVTDTVTLDNFNEYPYQELLKFVKETKRILQSPNSADNNRKKLLEKNFQTRYNAYLKGDNSDIRCPHPALNCPPVPSFGLVPPAPPIPLGPLPPHPVSQQPKPHDPSTYFHGYSIPASPPYRPPNTGFNRPEDQGLRGYPEVANPPPQVYGPPPNNRPTSGYSPPVVYRPVPAYSPPQSSTGGFGSYNRTVVTPLGVQVPRYPDPNAGPMPVDAGKGDKSGCQQIVQTIRPHRLKNIDGREHFILNLGNEFVQEIQIVQCRVYQSQCGDSSTWPETYEKRCVQSYNSFKSLFSVPVNKTINILDQGLNIFEVASGCHCSLKKQPYT